MRIQIGMIRTITCSSRFLVACEPLNVVGVESFNLHKEIKNEKTGDNFFLTECNKTEGK